MKKILNLFLLYTAVSVIMMLSALNSSAAYSDVKECKISVSPDADGSVTVTQEWNVEFKQGCDDNFDIKIPFSEDVRFSFAEIKDCSAGIDGVSCALVNESRSGDKVLPADNTYEMNRTPTGLRVLWNKKNDTESHKFRFTYTMTGIVKIIDNRAEFYCGYISEQDASRCESVEIGFFYPDGCSKKNVAVLTKNKYIGKKEDDRIVFSGGKINEDVFIGIGMPENCFYNVKNYTTSPQGLNGFEIFLIVLFSVLITTAVLCILFTDKVSRFVFINNCRKNVYSESSYSHQRLVFRKLEPAEILKITDNEKCHKADCFIATVITLLQKNMLKTQNGQIVKTNEKTELKPFEKYALSFFDGSEHSKMDFYLFINNFNKKVKGINIIQCFNSRYFSLEKRCWEIYLSSENYDTVSLEKTAVNAFLKNSVTPYETVIAFVRDNESGSGCRKGLAAFRDVYDEGKKELIEYKAEKKIKR